MGKIVFWLVIGVLAYVAWRVYTAGQRRPGAPGEPGAGPHRMGSGPRDPLGEETRDGEPLPRERVAPETMVRCQVCGVHLPGSEARYARGRVYCSDEHRDGDAA